MNKILDLLARAINWISSHMLTISLWVILFINIGFGSWTIYNAHGWARLGNIVIYSLLAVWIFWGKISDWAGRRAYATKRKAREDYDYSLQGEEND